MFTKILRPLQSVLKSTGEGAYIVLPQYLTALPYTTLENFETAPTGWSNAVGSATKTADTTNFKDGAQGLNATDIANNDPWFYEAVSWDMSAMQRLRIWAYFASNGADCPHDLKVMLCNDTGGWSNYFVYDIVIATKMAGWYPIDINKSAFTTGAGSPSWSSLIRRFGLRQSHYSVGDTTNVTWDKLQTSPAAPQAACLFTFDDGYEDIYTNALPIFQQHNCRATLYVITDKPNTGGNYITLAHLTALYNGGWDVGNHTKDHTYWVTSALTQPQIETELSAAKTALDGWGLTRASKHVAYPNGERGANGLAAMLAQGMLTGRMTQRNYYELIPPSDPLSLSVGPTSYLDNSLSLAQAKTTLDNCITTGRVAIFCGHYIEATNGVNQWATADLSALVAYAVAQGLPLLTISDFYNLQSGPVSIPRAL